MNSTDLMRRFLCARNFKIELTLERFGDGDERNNNCLAVWHIRIEWHVNAFVLCCHRKWHHRTFEVTNRRCAAFDSMWAMDNRKTVGHTHTHSQNKCSFRFIPLHIRQRHRLLRPFVDSSSPWFLCFFFSLLIAANRIEPYINEKHKWNSSEVKQKRNRNLAISCPYVRLQVI